MLINKQALKYACDGTPTASLWKSVVKAMEMKKKRADNRLACT